MKLFLITYANAAIVTPACGLARAFGCGVTLDHRRLVL